MLISSIKNNYLSPVELSNLYNKLYGGQLEVVVGIFKTSYITVIDGVRVQLNGDDLKQKLLEKI